jgi:two-component system, NtrC family, sensor kinase
LIEGAVKVIVMEAGEEAVHLPWLSPTRESLLALARESIEHAWPAVRHDPGAILLILRHVQPFSNASDFTRAVDQIALLRAAQRLLTECKNSSVRCFFERHEVCARVLRCGWRYATAANKMAERTGVIDGECAWVCGMLAPLGWLAVAACEPAKAKACLDDPEFPEQPSELERSLWSMDQDAIARRLLRRWDLPKWVSAIVGRLALGKEVAENLGCDLPLFRVVQAAILVVAQQGDDLRLDVAASIHEAIADLGLSAADFDAVSTESIQAATAQPFCGADQPPHGDPLLPDFLGLAADNCVLRQNRALESLESEQDQLHQLLRGGRQDDADRLRALKLEALAEFAAGAAHEINNPLAVISGQAQYLLGHEAETARQQSLHKIITQVQRVHQMLTELMQFARPARPQRQLVDPRVLARETLLSLHEFATHRQVRLESNDIEDMRELFVDAKQSRTALECLVRNAIEAAGPGGWVRLRSQTTPECFEFLIEDSGQGPNPAHAEHLFDPFFSGRQAGRGRGLGLPTAWRLAREQGGDVRHTAGPNGPTQFVLALPWGSRTRVESPSAPAAGSPTLPRIATA